jgi:hypothetical protein
MANRKSQKRNFQGMSYGEVQRLNSQNRTKLPKEKQQWLKENQYRNVGWENVIILYQKIDELLDQSRIEEMSLEELFLEADRIGNKYLSSEEIATFNQQLSHEVAEIEALVEKHFPDTEIEVIDFSTPTRKPQKKRNQKTYRTAKLQ